MKDAKAHVEYASARIAQERDCYRDQPAAADQEDKGEFFSLPSDDVRFGAASVKTYACASGTATRQLFRR